MWFLAAALLLTQPSAARDYAVSSQTVLQGNVLEISSFTGKATGARLNGLTIQLFSQDGGPALGLMPVAVLRKPGSYELEWLDAQGVVVHEAPVGVVSAHFARQNVVLTKALTELRSTPDERQTVEAFLKEVSPERHWQKPFEPPIPGCITSPFGVARLHNGKLTGDFHAGLDQRGPFGSPIHAITGGTVKIVQQFNLRGGTVAIDHGQGLESIYLHMSRFAATEGQQVKEGDVIGYVGSTGRSTAPHLHWSLYVYGQPVNPLQWMRLKSCASAAPVHRAASRR